MAYERGGPGKRSFAAWGPPIFLTYFLSVGADLRAAEYRVLPEQSILAIVTHKAGFASGKAHNHLIAASNYEARLELDGSNPLSSRFQLELAAEDLVVDGPEQRKEWYPRLEALGILDEPFKELSQKDREKIRETMLSKKQLDAAAYPKIRVRVEEILAESSTLGDEEFAYRVMVRFDVHGREVVAPIAARYVGDGGAVRIEAVGTLRFEDFGIKPYSAFLGAVKNQNEFHVYLALAAVPVEE